MQPTQLSNSDSMVLAHIFDPGSAPTAVDLIVDPYLPADRHVSDPAVIASLRQREKAIVAKIEVYEKTQKKTESKEHVYRLAHAAISELIDDFPKYASARNNRAQVVRWMYGDRNTLCQRRRTHDTKVASAASRAVDDLKQSITLASPAQPQDAVSPSQGRLLGQAHTQLAALYYAASKDLDSSSDVEVVCDDLCGWGKQDFEDSGSKNFYLGGLYGNEVAKALAIHTNPTAKLCGSIVREAMRKDFAQG